MNEDKEHMILVPMSYLKQNIDLRDWFAGMALQGYWLAVII